MENMHSWTKRPSRHPEALSPRSRRWAAQAGIVSLAIVPCRRCVSPQFGFGGAMHGEQAGARVDPEFPARLPHPGDGHPEADAPGGDAGTRDQLLNGQPDGWRVRFLLRQSRVSFEGGQDALA